MYYKIGDREFYLLAVYSKSGNSQIPMFFSRDITKAKTSTEEWIKNLKKFDTPYHYHNHKHTEIWKEFSRSLIYKHVFKKYAHKFLRLFKYKDHVLVDMVDRQDSAIFYFGEGSEWFSVHEMPGQYDCYSIILKAPATLVFWDYTILYVSINQNFEILTSTDLERISRLMFFEPKPKYTEIIKRRLVNIKNRLLVNLKPGLFDQEEFEFNNDIYLATLYNMKNNLMKNSLSELDVVLKQKIFTSEKFQEIIRKLNEIYSRGLHGEYYQEYKRKKLMQFLKG